MKTHLKHSAIMMLVIIASCSSLKTSPDVVNEVTQKVKSKNYTIEVNYANPMRWKQIYLNSDYDLRIKNDSAFAYLPFFGVAYSVPYGGDGGIKFSEPMSDYHITTNKKSDGWDIHFKIKAKETDYEIYLNIYNNGSSIISVNSFNKDAITFNGEIKK